MNYAAYAVSKSASIGWRVLVGLGGVSAFPKIGLLSMWKVPCFAEVLLIVLKLRLVSFKFFPVLVDDPSAIV